MALVITKTSFTGSRPTPVEIARKATEICGLPINYENCVDLPDMQEFAGELFFEVAPKERIEIRAYKSGAVKQFLEQTELPAGPTFMKTEGYDDAPGSLRVYTETYLGREPTLFNVVTLSLVRLGGILENKGDNLQAFDQKLTTAELLVRHRSNTARHQKLTPLYFLGGILLVLTLPFHLLWTVLRLPIRLLRIYRKNPELFRKPPRSAG